MTHKPRRMRENSDSDYIAVCSCGWESEPKPLQEVAREMLERHIEETREEAVSPEALSLAVKLNRVLAAPRRGGLSLELTVAEAHFLRRLLKG